MWMLTGSWSELAKYIFVIFDPKSAVLSDWLTSIISGIFLTDNTSMRPNQPPPKTKITNQNDLEAGKAKKK